MSNDLDRDAQAKEAWNIAVQLLKNAGMHESQARRYFGKLLAINRLHPSELLGAIRAAESIGTGDPAAYIAKAAQGRSQARHDPALACSWG